MIEFVFKPGAYTPIFHSSDGLYVRLFRDQQGPYRCAREEWERFLYPSGLFELVEKRREVGVGDAAKGKEK
jgi:hypothetical protein